jgi:hypothetical protein
MGTMLMLDTMGTRYHKLPSQLLREATTIDLYILSKVLDYYRRKQNPDVIQDSIDNVSLDTLMEMAEYAKEKQDGNSNSED